jgi:hypothetical protein
MLSELQFPLKSFTRPLVWQLNWIVPVMPSLFPTHVSFWRNLNRNLTKHLCKHKDNSSAYRRPVRARYNVPFSRQSNLALKNTKTVPQWFIWQGRSTDQGICLHRKSNRSMSEACSPPLTRNVLNSSSGHSSCGSDDGVHVSFHTVKKEVLPSLLYNWKGCLLHFPWQSRIPLHS